MKKDPLYRLLKKSGSIGLLCNQSGWHGFFGKYTFQWLAGQNRLKKIFIPEHGLFGELQDQVKLDDTSIYKEFAGGVEWISLYKSDEHALSASADQLSTLDTLVIDIQDAGSRYYTFTTTIWLLLKKITDQNLNMRVMVLDKPNPAGRQVEGTRIKKEFASFIGLEGLPHRHGLSVGEICQYFKNKLGGAWELVVVPFRKKNSVFISPSPNIPSAATCSVYPGQCLWEGTNISEGRGTTLPFETIGAPFLDWMFIEDWNNTDCPVYNKNCWVRPLVFIPVFHKYANQACRGLQLHVHEKKEYHSLGHSLQLMKYIKEKTVAFEWRPGKYEALNEKKAIELLVGDQLLLDYLENKASWKDVKLKLEEEESEWIKEVSPFLIYKSPLQKLKLR